MNELIEKISSQLRHAKIPLKSEYLSLFPQYSKELQNIFELHFLNDFTQEEFEEIIFRDNVVLIKKSQENIQKKLCISQKILHISFELLALRSHVYWNEQNPFQSFMARIGIKSFRVSMLHKATGSSSHQYFLRNSQIKSFAMESFLQKTSIVQRLINTRGNFLISGASGSGKTSFLNSILSSIPVNENIIVIEDLKEISIKQVHCSRLISKNSKQLKDFCAYALRMNPDRIILGEIRSQEIVPLVLAINSGVKGVTSTIHANSAIDAVDRMAQLFELFSQS